MFPIPQIIVTYFLIDRVFFRISQKVNNTYVYLPHYYSVKFYFLGGTVSHLLFWWGGFYNEFNSPQIAMILMTVFQLVTHAIRNKKKKQDSFDISLTILNFSFILLLLYLGKFYDNLNFNFLNFIPHAEGYHTDLYRYERRF